MDIDYTIRVNGMVIVDGCISSFDGETLGQQIVRTVKSFEENLVENIHQSNE